MNKEKTNLSLKELLAGPDGKGAEQSQSITMEITVVEKRCDTKTDINGNPYYTIILIYTLSNRSEPWTKRTRPYYDEGQLIWSEIKNIPGAQYRVRLELSDRRSPKSDKFYYDWVEIIPLDDQSGSETIELNDPEDDLLLNKVEAVESVGLA